MKDALPERQQQYDKGGVEKGQKGFKAVHAVSATTKAADMKPVSRLMIKISPVR